MGIAHGRLLLDKAGVLFGTASGNAHEYFSKSNGAVFELTKSRGSWNIAWLHKFTYDDNGRGTVFSLSQAGGVWTEIVLYIFGGTDGAQPKGVLTLDPGGALYGTTVSGGSAGKGTVFELAKSGGSWTETVLHSFAQGTDGAYPNAGVTEDSSGNLFGTTTRGGSAGWGTVCEIVP